MPQPAWVKGRLAPEPAASRFIYNTFFKRSSSYMATVIAFSTVAGIGYDYAMNYYWEMCNQGVRRPPIDVHAEAATSAGGGG